MADSPWSFGREIVCDSSDAPTDARFSSEVRTPVELAGHEHARGHMDLRSTLLFRSASLKYQARRLRIQIHPASLFSLAGHPRTVYSLRSAEFRFRESHDSRNSPIVGNRATGGISSAESHLRSARQEAEWGLQFAHFQRVLRAVYLPRDRHCPVRANLAVCRCGSMRKEVPGLE